jgi:hypothetical protein
MVRMREKAITGIKEWFLNKGLLEGLQNIKEHNV